MADFTASPNVPAASSQSASGWQPILTGDLAEQAHRAVSAVDDDLTRRAEQLVHDPSISSGSAGLAMFYAYLSQVDKTTQAEDKALDWLERSITQMCRQSLTPALHSGFSGVAWTLAHVSTAEDRIDDEQFTVVDEGLAGLLEPTTAGEYDLINGLVGIGVYARSGCPRPPRRPACGRLSIIWIARPCISPAERVGGRRSNGFRPFNAISIPMVTRIWAWPTACPAQWDCWRRRWRGRGRRAIATIAEQRLVEWLLAEQLPNHPAARFGYTAGDYSEPSRLAWCYGDLGIAAVLLSAARAADNATWEREAIQIARLAAQRTLANSGVQDAGLCHGSAGIAPLVQPLVPGHGPVGVARSRASLVRINIATAKHGARRGRVFRLGDTHAARRPVGRRSGLPGRASGVALALLAATGAVEPNWDRVLLCSLPWPLD